MQVWARDPHRVRRGVLTVIDAQCILRESGVGTWRMTIDETSQWSPQMQEGWGVVVLDDDGTTLFSGPAIEIGASQEGDTRDITLAGITDMHVLADRVVYPDPAKGYNAQTTTTHYHRAKGPAETLILNLVAGQCLPDPTWPTVVRTTAGLTLPLSQGRGASTSIEARFTNLLEEVQTLATVGGLVVDVVQQGNDLALQIRTPVNRARSVRFLPGAGLGDHSLSLTAPTVTTVILGAQGEGTARTITGRSSPTAERWGGRRIEVFEDRRDTTDTDELDKTLTEALAEGAPSSSATYTVTETPQLRFGTHYRLGDTVTVGLPNGAQVTDGARVADIAWDEFGRTVQLTVGEHSTDEDKAPAWVKRIKALQRQVRKLQVAQ